MSLNNEPRMDKNYWLALILSMFVMIGYSLYVQKAAPVKSVETEKITAISSRETAAPAEISVPGAAAESPAAQEASAANPETVLFQNGIYEAELSTLGASVTRLDYKAEKGQSGLASVSFYKAKEGEPGLFASRFLNDQVDLSRVVFKSLGQNGNRFEFVYEKAGDYRIHKAIYFGEAEPIIGAELTIENLGASDKFFPVEFFYGLHTADIDSHDRPMVEAVVLSDKIKEAHLDKVEKKGFLVNEDIVWAGVIKKYFALLVKPEGKTIRQNASADGVNVTASITMEPISVPRQGQAKREFFIYAGAQRYEVLKSFNMSFESVMSRGFFGFFKITLLKTLKFLNQYSHNFGWAIIFLTLILKGLFAPLTHMSFDSMRKMQALQPKMKSLQTHYKNDPTKLNQKMMELYKKHKVNPMGGCLPMLLQIPIFIAFYQMLNEAIELKGAPFIFWITDLAAADRLFVFPFTIPFFGDSFHLLPILMLISMIVQQRMTPQMGTTPEQVKMMNWMMPAMFGFMFYKMPSGLVLYWFVNNLLTIIHQGIIKRGAAIVLHPDDHEP